MAKRFTDTGKWKDTWFQDLPTKYKLFWIYLLDECDAAGLWKPNIRLAVFQIGETFEESELKRVFKERVEITETGYWFVKKFIEFQYGQLSALSKPHIAVLKLLENHKIKGYLKSIDTLKDKDKEKDKEKDKDKDKEKPSKKIEPPSPDEFLAYCRDEIFKSQFELYRFPCEAKYKAWADAGWKDGHGDLIKNWKTKIKNTVPYLKPFKPPTEKVPGKTLDQMVREYEEQQGEG